MQYLRVKLCQTVKNRGVGNDTLVSQTRNHRFVVLPSSVKSVDGRLVDGWLVDGWLVDGRSVDGWSVN